MNLIERSVDVVTGSRNIEDLHSLLNFPVFMGTVLHPRSEDLMSDMNWSISRDSGLIQLKTLLPLSILYQNQTTTSAVGAIWMEHHKRFAQYLSRYKPSSVFELGGAHGILAKEFQDIRLIPWAILEPNPSPVDGCRAHFIKGFFDSSFSFDGECDTVVHSHVFEHMYEPAEFMQLLSKFMPAGKNLIFSIPNMQVWLERKYTNCINFEHSIFLTEPYVDYLLAKYGFRLLEKEYFRDGHSIFYAATRDPSVCAYPLPDNLYYQNKNIYLEFVRYHLELIESINLRVTESTKPVYLFGAHVFAQYLISFGLDTSRIVSLLDNDPKKHGRRLYGTSLMVQSPKVLREVVDAVVILKAGVYNQEIKEDILGNINSKVIFFE